MGLIRELTAPFLPQKAHSKQLNRRDIQSNSFTINNYGWSDPDPKNGGRYWS